MGNDKLKYLFVLTLLLLPSFSLTATWVKVRDTSAMSCIDLIPLDSPLSDSVRWEVKNINYDCLKKEIETLFYGMDVKTPLTSEEWIDSIKYTYVIPVKELIGSEIYTREGVTLADVLEIEGKFPTIRVDLSKVGASRNGIIFGWGSEEWGVIYNANVDIGTYLNATNSTVWCFDCSNYTESGNFSTQNRNVWANVTSNTTYWKINGTTPAYEEFQLWVSIHSGSYDVEIQTPIGSVYPHNYSVTNLTTAPPLINTAEFVEGLSYKVPFYVNESASLDYSDGWLNITFNSSALIVANKMLSDCSDVRFSNSTGGLLNFSLFNCDGGATDTTVQIKIDFLDADDVNREFALYYGNTSMITSMSNWSSTYPLWEDCNTVDTNKFEVKGSVTASGGDCILDANDEAMIEHTNTTTRNWYGEIKFSGTGTESSKYIRAGFNIWRPAFYGTWGRGVNILYGTAGDDRLARTYNDAGTQQSVEVENSPGDGDAVHIWKFLFNSTDSTFYKDGSHWYTLDANTPMSNTTGLSIDVDGTSITATIDYFKRWRYTPSNPTYYWGTESTEGTPSNRTYLISWTTGWKYCTEHGNCTADYYCTLTGDENSQCTLDKQSTTTILTASQYTSGDVPLIANYSYSGSFVSGATGWFALYNASVNGTLLYNLSGTEGTGYYYASVNLTELEGYYLVAEFSNQPYYASDSSTHSFDVINFDLNVTFPSEQSKLKSRKIYPQIVVNISNFYNTASCRYLHNIQKFGWFTVTNNIPYDESPIDLINGENILTVECTTGDISIIKTVTFSTSAVPDIYLLGINLNAHLFTQIMLARTKDFINIIGKPIMGMEMMIGIFVIIGYVFIQGQSFILKGDKR